MNTKEKIQHSFSKKMKFFIQEYVFENIVCEMAAILSLGNLVNSAARDNEWM